MANVQATTGDVFTRSVAAAPISAAEAGQRRRRGLIGLAVVVALIAVGLFAYVRLTAPHAPAAPVSKIATAVDVDRAEYAPGGSVYEQQVPQQAGAADLSHFQPGGSVHEQQVPEQAGPTDLSSYQLGGSVYEQQVPGQ